MMMMMSILWKPDYFEARKGAFGFGLLILVKGGFGFLTCHLGVLHDFYSYMTRFFFSFPFFPFM